MYDIVYNHIYECVCVYIKLRPIQDTR